MPTLFVSQPVKELYHQPIFGNDKKEALLNVIDEFAPDAYKIAKIKKTMTYEEIENRIADDYLADFDKPYYPQYFEVYIKMKGKLRKLF